MSAAKSKAWKTKNGSIRVREEAPTLQEAIEAAQGLTDQIDEQVEIAASLMGLPHEDVRAVLVKAAAPRKTLTRGVVFTGPLSAPRAVAVERKPARRIIPGASRTLLRPALSSTQRA